jgi:chemotaxis protein histidine kinase CheA
LRTRNTKEKKEWERKMEGEIQSELMELLDRLKTNLLKLEKQKEDVDQFAGGMLNTTNSMKKSCGGCGLIKQVALLHEMGNVFKALEEKELSPETEVVDALLEAHDLLKKSHSGIEADDYRVFGVAIAKLSQLMPGRTVKI